MKVEVTRERLAFGLTILVIIIGGAVAWGDLKARAGKIDKLEDRPAKIASVQTDLGNIRGDISSLRNLSNTVAGLDKTVASLNDTVKRFEATNLPARVASLDATVTGLKNAVDRLEARQEKSASKEDIARIEGELKDLQRMLIQKGVARTSNLPALEDALRGTPSLKAEDLLNRKTFYIVPEDEVKANELLERWSLKSPIDPPKIAAEYFPLFKPETRIWEAPPDSDVAYLYNYGQIPFAVLDSFKRVVSSPSAVMVPFGFGLGFTK